MDPSNRELNTGNDMVLEHVVHLRVLGMMCQKNCGSTVQKALEDMPGCVSAKASFATSHASAVVNLKTYARQSEETYQIDSFTSGCDGEYISELRIKVEELAVDTVECIGFDASLLGPDDVVELVEENSTKQNLIDPEVSNIELEKLNAFDESSESIIAEPTISLQVSGMSCAVCSGKVERAVNAVSGVTSSVVSVVMSRAKVKCIKDGGCDMMKDTNIEKWENEVQERVYAIAKECASSIQKAGYDCELLEVEIPTIQTQGTGGLTLSESATKMENARLEELHIWSRLLLIASILTVPLIAMHYTSMISHEMDDKSMTRREWIAAFLATPVQFGVGKRFYIAAYHSLANGGIMGMDFLVVLGTTASYVYSIIVLLVNTFNFDFLDDDAPRMSPTFATGAMLLMFVTLGKFLESYAKGKTASAIQSLMELQPVTAIRCTIDSYDGDKLPDTFSINTLQRSEVNINDVKASDHLIVIPGARIPTDGVIVYSEGTVKGSYVDESALSGEPFPVAKFVGDKVYGSTINQSNLLVVRVTAVGNGTVLSRIVRLIEEAQVNRAPIQALADSVASVFAPAVIVIATLTFFGWMTFNHAATEFQERLFIALMSAISVVVVACPCALGLATPTAVMVGTGVGATNGLLIKGGAVLEEAYGVDTVIFDKTGTLTMGKAVLGERIEFLDNSKDSEPLLRNLPNKVEKHNVALWLAACAEMSSDHPLASAIVNAAKGIFGSDFTCSSDGVLVKDSKVIPGHGVEAVVSQKDWGEWIVRVGKRSFVYDETASLDATSSEERKRIEKSGDREADYLRRRGHIAIYVGVMSTQSSTTRVIGVLGIEDSVKPVASSTVMALKSMGIDVWMCTGDHELTAQAVAANIGIDLENVCANVLPENKADLVTRLQKQKRQRHASSFLKRNKDEGQVAFVGDGINDSVAMARANVGIAIGTGTEVAIEAADIVLMGSNLHDIVVALHLSRVVFNRIKMNLFWAMGYNVFAIPFAAGVFFSITQWRVPPAFAGFMMAFSSVSVVTSSLLLRMYKKPIVHDDGAIQEHGMHSCFFDIMQRSSNCCPRESRRNVHGGEWQKIKSNIT